MPASAIFKYSIRRAAPCCSWADSARTRATFSFLRQFSSTRKIVFTFPTVQTRGFRYFSSSGAVEERAPESYQNQGVEELQMNVRSLILMATALAVASPVFAQFTGDGFKNTVVGSPHDLSANTDVGIAGATAVC